MATLNTLVTQLVAKVEPFKRGLDQAEARLAKFQKSLVGKALSAGAIIGVSDKTFRALGDELDRIRVNGFNAADSMQRLGEGVVDLAKGVPVLGALGNVIGELLANSVFDDLFGGPIAAERELVRLAKERADALERSLATTRAMATINSAIIRAQDLFALATTTTDAARNAIKLQMELDGIRERWAKIAEAARQSGLEGAAYAELMERIAAGQAMEEEAAKINAVREAYERLNSTLDAQLDIRRKMEEAAERMQNLMDEGRRLTEDVRTAQEIYNDAIAHYRELLEAGAISEETFRRAVEKAQEALDAASESARVRPGSAAEVFQSPAAIERRFGRGMPTGRAANDPGLQLVKKTDLMFNDGKQRTALMRQLVAGQKEMTDKLPDFEVVGLN